MVSDASRRGDLPRDRPRGRVRLAGDDPARTDRLAGDVAFPERDTGAFRHRRPRSPPRIRDRDGKCIARESPRRATRRDTRFDVPGRYELPRGRSAESSELPRAYVREYLGCDGRRLSRPSGRRNRRAAFGGGRALARVHGRTDDGWMYEQSVYVRGEAQPVRVLRRWMSAEHRPA